MELIIKGTPEEIKKVLQAIASSEEQPRRKHPEARVQKGGLTMKEEKLTVKIELVGVEEATAKAERYVELLKEAKTLADELASVEFEITSSSQQ